MDQPNRRLSPMEFLAQLKAGGKSSKHLPKKGSTPPGEVQLDFSDYLGNKRAFILFDSVSTFTNFRVGYFNLSKRFQWGIQIYDQRTLRGYTDFVSATVDRWDRIIPNYDVLVVSRTLNPILAKKVSRRAGWTSISPGRAPTTPGTPRRTPARRSRR
jgi:hypothetical protein